MQKGVTLELLLQLANHKKNNENLHQNEFYYIIFLFFAILTHALSEYKAGGKGDLQHNVSCSSACESPFEVRWVQFNWDRFLLEGKTKTLCKKFC